MHTKKIVCVSGWTGSGKTTVINDILKKKPSFKSTVIIRSQSNPMVDARRIVGAAEVLTMSMGDLYGDRFVSELVETATKPNAELVIFETPCIDIDRFIGTCESVLLRPIHVVCLGKNDAVSGLISDTSKAIVKSADAVVVLNNGSSTDETANVIRGINPAAEVFIRKEGYSDKIIDFITSFSHQNESHCAVMEERCHARYQWVDFFDPRTVSPADLSKELAGFSARIIRTKCNTSIGLAALSGGFDIDERLVLSADMPINSMHISPMIKHGDEEPERAYKNSTAAGICIEAADLVTAELDLSDIFASSLSDNADIKENDDEGFMGRIIDSLDDGDVEAALSLCEERIKSVGGTIPLLRQFGSVLKETGELWGALTFYRYVCSRLRNSPEAHEDVARIYNRLDDYPRAIAFLERAVELDPGYFSAFMNMARLHLAYGDFKNAVSAIEKAGAISREGEEFLSLAARVYSAGGMFSDAALYYSLLLEIRPDDPLILSGMAYALNDSGEPARAVDFQKRVAELDPDEGAYYFLGFLYLRIGEHIMAGENLRKAVEWGNDESFVHLCLGLVQKAIGNKEEADEFFQRALEIADSLYGKHPEDPMFFEAAILSAVATNRDDIVRRIRAHIRNSYCFSAEFEQFLEMMNSFPLSADMVAIIHGNNPT